MSWVRLDDRFYSHRKVMSVSLAARWLYVSALCVANQHSNNGILDQAAQDCLLVAVGRSGSFDVLAAELVSAGLWERHGVTDYTIHDYLEYQPSDEEQRKERAAAAERQRRFRERRHGGNATNNASSNGVTNGVENGPPSLPVPSRPYPSRPGIKEDLAVGHAPPPPSVVLSGQSQPRQESQQAALIPEALASPKPAPERSAKPRKAPEPTRVALAWRAYCAAIAERYPGEDPVWNPKMGGIFGNLVKQLGDAAAPVAVFYVKHNHRTYIEKKHVPEYLILNATTLHREWQAGEAMTATRAQQAERTASNPFLEELAERRRARAAADQIECQVEGDNVSGKR